MKRVLTYALMVGMLSFGVPHAFGNLITRGDGKNLEKKMTMEERQGWYEERKAERKKAQETLESQPELANDEEETIDEQVIPPGLDSQEGSGSGSTEEEEENMDEEDQASINHFGDSDNQEEKESPADSIQPEVVEETAEVKEVFAADEEDVEIIQAKKAIAEDIIPPPAQQSDKYQDVPVEEPDEEFDPPPMPTAVKVLMVILGIAVLTGSVYLGTMEKLPW